MYAISATLIQPGAASQSGWVRCSRTMQPRPPEELGIEPAPQRAADLIANMTDAERQELAALIAPPPTLGQEAKQ